MIGRRLAHFEILGLLGKGGMGEVYRARDTKLDREVALKVLPAAAASRADRLERFRREARSLAALDHPGIVTVYSVEEADGVHFFTMQLVEGEPLNDVVPAGGLAVDRLLQIALPMCEAVAAAHGQGIVHRDLKPANVMLTGDGRVKVLDFGLAKLADSGDGPGAESAATVAVPTREGDVVGTLPYMSPEQVRGSAVDHRTDIFSFGVILYHMATGRQPFVANSSAELASAIMRDTPRPATESRPDLPKPLGRVISRCLEKDPNDRFSDMQEVLAALRIPVTGERERMPAPSRSTFHRAWFGVGAAVLLAAAFLLARTTLFGPAVRDGGDGGTAEIRSIAVLPLDNYSGDPGQDYFAEGMTDAVTADLAQISKLRVISRGSAMRFKGPDRPATPEIAKLLDVDAIVEGSVYRAEDQVRVTAQLIDARADRHLWAESFERNSHDVLALQSDLAAAIARAIDVQLTPAEETRLSSAPSVDPEAYDAYLKGRYFFNRPSDENLQKAITRFEDALALDPDFVPALAGLSDAYLWAGYNEGFLTASAARPRALQAVEKAIRLDPNSAEAHASLANFKLWYEYDWAGAEAEFDRAIALNPNYAYAHDQFGVGLAFQGRFEESIAAGRRAMELDPLNPQIPLDATVGLGLKGDFEEARELVRRSEELDPTYFFSQWSYGWIAIQEGRIAEAIPFLQRAKELGAPAFDAALLACAYGSIGDSVRAAAEVEELERMSLHGTVTPFNLALVALGAGENARAVSYLEQAYAMDSQWLGWLGQDRVFDPLRQEPRFVELLRKLGLEN